MDDDILDQIEDSLDDLCADDDSEACEQLEEAVEEMASFDPRDVVELNPGTVEGTFYNISVSFDGDDPISLYGDVGLESGSVINVAEDSYKGVRTTPGQLTVEEAREYLDRLIRLPAPMDTDGDVVRLPDAKFYFTQAGFDHYIESRGKLERVLNGATTYAPYTDAEVFIDTVTNPSNVVYRDSAQIAVGVSPGNEPTDPLTYTEFTRGKHSYRGYSPEMVERLIATIGTERFEKGVEASARDGIDFIESGRWSEFLEEASQMFNRLDDDERDLFTRRNPDVVEWITVHDEANGYDPMERWRNDARAELGSDGARDPPMFVRGRGSAPPNDDLIESMIQRRRSYRNWTPQEFQDVLDMGEITVTEGRAREIGMRTPEILDTMREEGAFPIDVGAKEVSRELLGRVEAGRFMSMLDVLMTFYVALDLDERRMFSRRNPGLVMWVSVYGESNHLVHREQLKAHTYPTLREK